MAQGCLSGFDTAASQPRDLPYSTQDLTVKKKKQNCKQSLHKSREILLGKAFPNKLLARKIHIHSRYLHPSVSGQQLIATAPVKQPPQRPELLFKPLCLHHLSKVESPRLKARQNTLLSAALTNKSSGCVRPPFPNTLPAASETPRHLPGKAPALLQAPVPTPPHLELCIDRKSSAGFTYSNSSTE